MSLSLDLLEHATDLLTLARQSERKNVLLRRAVSAAYYALFHHLTVEGASLIAPNVPVQTLHRIGRWFDHAEMKKVCGRFAKSKLDQPLRELIGDSASPSLQDLTRSFIKLQEARHAADYDLSYILGTEEAQQYVLQAVKAIADWQSLATSAEANIFILSLLLWKNWERDRP